jgi:DNA-binding NarL/FixJ family response regulator
MEQSMTESMIPQGQIKIIKFIVADDHPIVRRGLIETLEDEPDFAVIAEAGSGPGAVELVRRFQPHIVILDINMPSCGLAASRQIKNDYPHIHTIMYSFRQDQEIVQRSLQAGASLYFVKGTAGGDIIAGLRAILDGRLCHYSSLKSFS